MGTGEVVALGATALALFGSIGATVRWAAVQFKAQGKEVDKLKSEHAALYREHSLVLVLVERFRLAFQLVAVELQHRSPGNIALAQAAAILEKSFQLDPSVPIDMAELLRRAGE